MFLSIHSFANDAILIDFRKTWQSHSQIFWPIYLQITIRYMLKLTTK